MENTTSQDRQRASKGARRVTLRLAFAMCLASVTLVQGLLGLYDWHVSSVRRSLASEALAAYDTDGYLSSVLTGGRR